MRLFQIVSCFLSFLLFFVPSGPPLAANAQQQQSAPDAQAVSLAQRALGVLTGGRPISDVTLTGSARRIAGSDDETGPAVLKALATGESRMDLNLPSGQRSEVRANSGNGPVGSWSGPDSAQHPISNHNLMADSAWFFPAFAAGKSLGQGYTASLVGQETRAGQSVIHVTTRRGVVIPSEPAAAGDEGSLPGDTATLMQHLSQVDFFLDPSTLLPVALAFNTHPDNDAGLDIPVEIRFSDYRVVNGAQVPFHVQKFLNNGLVLDLQFQTVTFNAGLSSADFVVAGLFTLSREGQTGSSSGVPVPPSASGMTP